MNSTYKNLKLSTKKKKKSNAIHNPKSNQNSQKLSKFSPNIRSEIGQNGRGGQQEQRLGIRERQLGMQDWQDR